MGSKWPAWRYHQDKPEGKVFQSAEDVRAAGPGWVDSPAKIGQPAEKETEVEPEEPVIEEPVVAAVEPDASPLTDDVTPEVVAPEEAPVAAAEEWQPEYGDGPAAEPVKAEKKSGKKSGK